MGVRATRTLALLYLGVSFAFLVGCAGLEHVPGGKYPFYHHELPDARRAVDAARAAGKDKQCPAEFQAAENLVNEVFRIYDACTYQQAIGMANQAIAMVNALCPKSPEPPRPTPAPAPAPQAAPAVPAPEISLTGNPGSVDQGACSTLTWSATNTNSASWNEGIGPVGASGSRQVCPSGTTQYTLTATGGGGTRTASTTVSVNPKPAAAPIDRLTIHVNFDTARSQIRKSDFADLQKAVAFVKKYPGCKVSVDGFTDSRGREKYNLGLSQRRAAAVKDYLLAHGATDADKISSQGFGEANPVGDNDTEQGRFENRRVEIVIVSR